MYLLKFFLSSGWPAPRRKNATFGPDSDPLLHPDLEVMTLTELADLPLMPANLGRRMSDTKPSKKTLSPQPGG